MFTYFGSLVGLSGSLLGAGAFCAFSLLAALRVGFGLTGCLFELCTLEGYNHTNAKNKKYRGVSTQ